MSIGAGIAGAVGGTVHCRRSAPEAPLLDRSRSVDHRSLPHPDAIGMKATVSG